MVRVHVRPLESSGSNFGAFFCFLTFRNLAALSSRRATFGVSPVLDNLTPFPCRSFFASEVHRTKIAFGRFIRIRALSAARQKNAATVRLPSRRFQFRLFCAVSLIRQLAHQGEGRTVDDLHLAELAGQRTRAVTDDDAVANRSPGQQRFCSFPPGSAAYSSA